ncbi:peptidoglycan DD-metalloendopeptidase family protein [Cohnella faecalis]|uniref:M23 family peptidase n=1 Tax=Cohnella faecalis TaxID=2315694 RepID=A0A398CI42_9BACL|nr:M23 family metallopeptidase [Cohnella faecalis]RIE02015.1 M23 family peptidase [Cohnella faecalis]
MINDNNKPTRKLEDSQKSVTGSHSAAKPSGWKKLLSKRWVFPAAYMAAAAIIVTILWMNSDTDKADKTSPAVSSVSSEQTDGASSPDAAPAVANGEALQWPVAKMDDMKTLIPFYDAAASEEERVAAMVEYPNNTFAPHMAIDLARKDAQSFDVQAALGGEVTVAEQTAKNGYEVHIKHANGLETVYQSLTDLKVKSGDKVEQGDVIAKAAQSESEPGEGIHVHFEVRNNGQSVNPTSLIAK